jgi:hypothetical protein
LEEAVHDKALELLTTSFTLHIVNHAAITFKTTTNEVIEANCVSHREAFILTIRADRLNVANAFMSNGDRIVGSHVE